MIVQAIRWTARIWSVLSIAFILVFWIGEGMQDPGGFDRITPLEILMKLFFPVGVCVGMGIGWRREMAGGWIAVGSLFMFYILNAVFSGDFPSGPWFLLVSAPGFLFLAAGLAMKRT